MARFIKFFSSRYWISKFRRLSENFYALLDSKLKCNAKEKILFIDCGSNTGQGYKWFARFYNGPNVDFELFEPNPNCHPQLEKLISTFNHSRVNLNKCGVGTRTHTANFFGLEPSQGGVLSQGGSIVRNHNSAFYETTNRIHIEVSIIDFSEFLTEKSRHYDKIIVKMDIEGAEVELMEKLLLDHSINKINILYLELHAQYQSEPFKTLTRVREQNILKSLSNSTNVITRLWH